MWTNIKQLSENGGIGIFLFFLFVKYIGVSLLIVSILNSIPTTYLSYQTNLEIMKFCNRTENLMNYTSCRKRLYNNTDFVLSLSTENLRIYNNLTKEIEIKNNKTLLNNTNNTNNTNSTNNVNNTSEFKKVDFNLLSLITQITLFLIYLMFYNNVKNQSNEVDIMNISPSDYTLMLSEFKLPEDVKDFEQLKDYLETEEVKIHSIYPIYKMKEYNESYKNFYSNFTLLNKMVSANV